MEEATQIFYTHMENCIDLHVPTVLLKHGRINHPPWFDKKLINLKNRRDKARKRIKVSGSTTEFDEVHTEFVSYNDQRILEFHTENYILCRKDPKKFWNYVNSKRTSTGYPTNMEYEGKIAENDQQTAQLFNDFFSTVYTEPENFSFDNFISSTSIESKEIEPITIEETHKALLAIDVSKGVGLDGIHPLLLKECASSLAAPVCELFNKYSINMEKNESDSNTQIRQQNQR